MKVRRVVTGKTGENTFGVVSDELVDEVEISLAPGFGFYALWGSDDIAHYSADGTQPTFSTWFPPQGGFRFDLNTIPPDSAAPPAPDVSSQKRQRIQDAGLQEADVKLPGLFAAMDPDHPGFHRSETVDLLYVASGEVVLELDAGETVALKAGDTLVQNATRHAWHNPGSEPCVLITVTIGAQPESS